MNKPKIIKVEKKPKICPNCKGRVVKILYGEPTDEAMEESENKKIIIGGCCISDDDPQWGCVDCDYKFLKVSNKELDQI